MNDVQDILKEFGQKLEKNLDFEDIATDEAFSREYIEFRREHLSSYSYFYEDLCKFSEGILKLQPDKKTLDEVNKAIEVSHLDVTAEGASSFALLVAAGFILISIFLIVGSLLLGGLMLFLPIVLAFSGVLLIKPLSKLPIYIANRWRLEASNQMVLCILYAVMYMRHTSNLEHAIKFAGEHIGEPLALDLRKVFWDVETGKYSTIKESLDNYLDEWKDYSLEFVESFHLIEESLYEGREDRRIELLDKSLEIMLTGSYERMMDFAHNVKSPVTMLYMLGVILPVLGLVMFPLVGSFMQGMVKWWHLAFLYNIILPVGVIIMGYNALSKRPTGYGGSEILKKHPELEEFSRSKFLGMDVELEPKYVALLIIFLFCFIGFLPVTLHYIIPSLDTVGFLEELPFGGKFLDYKCNENGCLGPYGFWAVLISLFIPLGIALGYGLYCKLKTDKLMEIRDVTNKLEREFAGSLFQLGNRVGEGIPVELAFGRVAENLKGTPTGDFFNRVNMNIRRFGMSVNEAIFNSEKGAILAFPSGLIESSMKVLVEAARKGPNVVAKTMISISNYVGRIHDVNERLKDLMADIISSMKSQISFLTPMIAGIVIAVASMLVSIINKLTEQFQRLSAEGGESIGGNLAGVVNIIKIEYVIPSFHFQLIVGLYVVEITIILTILGNSLENAGDKVAERNSIGKNLIMGISLYTIIAFLGVFIFNILASGVSQMSMGG